MSFDGGIPLYDDQLRQPDPQDDSKNDLEDPPYEDYEGDGPLVYDADDYGSTSQIADGSPKYDETPFETTTVRCCGGFCCVFLSMLVLAWTVHAIPVATITDIPPFARSALWMSLAHHTDPWKQLQGGVSPPPPSFGDGIGNFPDPE